MKRQQVLLRSSLAFAALLSGIVGATPGHTHALSLHDLSPSQLAWVVDDATAQAHCTVNGIACPTDGVQVLTVYTIPLINAEVQGRPYIRADVSSAEQNQFVQHVAQQLPTALHAHAVQSSTVQPYCSGGGFSSVNNSPRNYTLSINGATVQENFTYLYNPCYLGGPVKAADHMGMSLVGGRMVYKSDTATVNYGSTRVDQDTNWAGTCSSLPWGSTFNDVPEPADYLLYVTTKYSSGSNCTVFDTYSYVNYNF